MKRKKSFIKMFIPLGLILQLAWSGNAWAAETANNLTLSEIVNTSLTNNPSVIESEKLWEEKEHRVPLATALPDPTIGFMKDDIPRSTFDIGKAMMSEITLSQEFMNPAKVKVMGKMAKNDAEMAKAKWLGTKMEVYSGAKKAYYDYLYAQKALDLGQESLVRMEQLVTLARINYETGMVPLQDMLKVQTEYSSMKSDLLEMTAMTTLSKAKINNYMGRSADLDFSVKEEFLAPTLENDVAALKTEALEKRPEIIEMQKQEQMAINGVQLAKKEQLPDFTISIGYKKNKELMIEKEGNMLMAEDRKPTWKFELMVMMPLWYDKNNARIDAAQSALAATMAASKKMKDMTELDLLMALTDAQVVQRRIKLYRNTLIPQVEQSYRAGLQSYTDGRGELMNVLEGMTALRDAQLGLYKAQTDYEKALAEVEKILGRPLFGLEGASKTIGEVPK